MKYSFCFFLFIIILFFSNCHSGKPEISPSAKEVVLEYINGVIVGKYYDKLPLLLSDDFVNELSPKFRGPSNNHIISQGLDAHREHLQSLHHERDISVKILDVIQEDNIVVIMMLVTHSYKDGRKATFPWAGFFTVEDGKITRARHIHDTLLEYIQLNEVSR